MAGDNIGAMIEEITNDFVSAWEKPGETFTGPTARLVARWVLPQWVNPGDARVRDIVRKCNAAWEAEVGLDREMKKIEATALTPSDALFQIAELCGCTDLSKFPDPPKVVVEMVRTLVKSHKRMEDHIDRALEILQEQEP